MSVWRIVPGRATTHWLLAWWLGYRYRLVQTDEYPTHLAYYLNTNDLWLCYSTRSFCYWFCIWLIMMIQYGVILTQWIIYSNTGLNWTLALLIVLPVATGAPVSLDFIGYHNRRAKWPWITPDPTCPAESPNWISVPGSTSDCLLPHSPRNPLQRLFL